jgi:hypothetical protein
MKSVLRHVLICSLLGFPALLLVDRPANARAEDNCNLFFCVVHYQVCTYQVPSGKCYVWQDAFTITTTDGDKKGKNGPHIPSHVPVVVNGPSVVPSGAAVSAKPIAPPTGAVLGATTNWQNAGALAVGTNGRRPR